MQHKEPLPVIFRTDRRAKDDTFAILPTVDANPGRLVVYQDVGGHCEGTWEGTIGTSRPAKPREYRRLLTELRRIYKEYKLVVYRRLQRRWQEEREDQNAGRSGGPGR